MDKNEPVHSKLIPTGRKAVVGYWGRDGISCLTTLIGETDYYVVDIPPGKSIGFMSGHGNFYEFTEKLSHADRLAVAADMGAHW